MNSQLLFLDSLLITNKNKNGHLGMNTNKLTMADSHYFGQHKMVAISFLVNEQISKARFNNNENVAIYNPCEDVVRNRKTPWRKLHDLNPLLNYLYTDISRYRKGTHC